jgi:hypothetical protein
MRLVIWSTSYNSVTATRFQTSSRVPVMTNRPLSDMKNVLSPALTMLQPWKGNAFSPSMLALESKSAVSETDGEAGLVSADASPDTQMFVAITPDIFS